MISPETLRKAQLIMLDMLIEFDAVCKKHQLQYWLDSGTLLGAVRHRGFIPWDDDIDISMPVEDYHKMLEVAQKEFSDNIFLQNSTTDQYFNFDYTKLRSNKASIVEFHEQDQDVEYHQGVFVDIFPMLTIDNTEENKVLYNQTFENIRRVSSISLHTPEGKSDPASRAKLVNNLYRMHKGWQQNNLKVIYGGEMPDIAAWFDLAEVFPLSSLQFEGRQFPAPGNPDHYLKAIYSFDYRQLPPEDKRLIHAHSISFA